MTEISKEYAAALFMLACEKNQKNEYGDALESVKNALKDEPDYFEFLSSPGIPVKDRTESIRTVFGEIVPEDVLSFVQLVCEKGRMKCFYEAVEDYSSLLAQSNLVKNVKVTSAVSLTEAEKEKLQKKLETVYKSNVEIEYLIDASLVGGVIMEVDGKILDGSVKSRLRDIKEVISV